MLEEDFDLSKKTNAVQLQGRAQIPFSGGKKNIVVQQETAITVEVVEELTEDELADRHRLEMKVERAFYEAGVALRELRDRRLYRSTHKTFEDYCQDRFGFTRHAANFKIAASNVFENLVTKSHQTDVAEVNENLVTKSHQILPTKETQVRPLAKLEPELQRQLWEHSVAAAGGKVPTERLVKAEVLRHQSVVDCPKQKTPPPEFAHDDVVEIKALKHSPLRRFDGMWGTIEHVGSYSYTVRVSIAREVQQCKGEEMTRIDDEYISDIKAVSQRIAALVKFDLEPVEYAILEVLQRSKCFTPRQLLYLERMEKDYGLPTTQNPINCDF